MNQRISQFLYHRYTAFAAVGTSSLLAGLGIGFVIGKKKAAVTLQLIESENYQLDLFQDYVPESVEVINHEINVLARDSKALHLVTDALEQLAEPEPEKRNVFDNADEGWDYEAEYQTRTPDAPYILHQEEFFADEMGFRQTTLTYYNGDCILVDEQDVPIYGHDKVVGELKFGHGSGDKNVLYVRNEKLHAEYEVLFSSDYYESVVLGNQIENDLSSDDLKHSARRFRDSD